MRIKEDDMEQKQSELEDKLKEMEEAIDELESLNSALKRRTEKYKDELTLQNILLKTSKELEKVKKEI